MLGRAGGCLAQCSSVTIADHSSDTRSLAESMRARLSAGMLSAVRGRARAPTVASKQQLRSSQLTARGRDSRDSVQPVSRAVESTTSIFQRS